MVKRYRKKESGTGMAEVLVYVGVVAIVWFIIYLIMHYIYSTKESRLDRRAQAAEEFKKKKKSGIDLSARGPGGYQVNCSGLFRKECDQ